eukprot:432506_1
MKAILESMIPDSILMDRLLYTGERVFINGYTQQEFQRMKDMNQMCDHLNFDSISQYFDSLHNLLNMLNDKDKQKELTKERFIKLGSASALCKQCSLYNATNFIQFANWNKQIGSVPSGTVKIIKYSPLLANSSLFIIMFMTYILQYQPTARIVFNYSNLWIIYMQYIIISMHTVTLQHNEELNHVYHKSRHENIDYAALFYHFNQVFRNIKLLKLYHWKGYIYSVFFQNWLEFVHTHLKSGLYLKYYQGGECIHSFFILICHAMYYINNNKWQQKKEMICKWFDDLSNISRDILFKSFMKDVQNHNNEAPLLGDDIDRLRTIGMFLLLKNDDHVNTLYTKYSKWGQKIYEIKWNDTQCQNHFCNIRRRTAINNKLYKCKSCRVAKYCNKYCQKKDWRNHKQCCRKLKKMRKKEKMDRNIRSSYLVKLIL